MSNEPVRHHHEVTYDPHCLDDLGYPDDEIPPPSDATVITICLVLVTLLISTIAVIL